MLSARLRSPRGWLFLVAIVGLYAVFIAATPLSWVIPELRLVNVALMALVVVAWSLRLPFGMDDIDLATVAVIVVTGIGAATAILPRFAIEAWFGIVFFSALFGTVRSLGESQRRTLIRVMAVTAGVLAAVVLANWASVWLRWLSVTEWHGFPPFGIRVPGAPFGHPHDVALLVGLLSPAVWSASSSTRARRGLVVAIATGVAVVMFMSGSRAAWAAAVAATIVSLWASGRRPAFRVDRRVVVAVAVVGIAFAGALIAGVVGPIVERLTTTLTVEMRLAIWQRALTAWLERPLLGTGPGTFESSLFGGTYFENLVFAPKHADNVYVQALSELGVIGCLSIVLVIAAMAIAWRSRQAPIASIWALTFAAVAGIGANPTAYGFTALIIVVWAALSVPRTRPRRSLAAGLPIATLRAGMAVALFVACLPVLTTTWAAFVYDDARAAAAAGSAEVTEASLRTAVHLDPRFAIYRRELGTILSQSDRVAEARKEIVAAISANPFDDSALRASALLELEAGNPRVALAQATAAAELQDTDPRNQALLAYVAAATGDRIAEETALAKLLVISPWPGFDSQWQALFPAVGPPVAAARTSTALAAGDTPIDTDQGWLSALANPTSSERAEPVPSAAQVALARLMGCDVAGAERILDKTPDMTDVNYWLVRSVHGQLVGAPDAEALSALEAARFSTGSNVFSDSPIRDDVADANIYARLPLPSTEHIHFPSPANGLRTLTTDPELAIRSWTGSGC